MSCSKSPKVLALRLESAVHFGCCEHWSRQVRAAIPVTMTEGEREVAVWGKRGAAGGDNNGDCSSGER